MRFSTAAVAGLAVTAQAAVPKRSIKDLFKGEFKFPEGITIAKEELVGPWEGPGDDDSDVYHPSHEGVVIDHCDKKGEKDWHWVHEDKRDESKDDEYKWTTETITATETIIDCGEEKPCDGGKTVTVTIPETTTICPTPVEPPVEEPPVEEPPHESPPPPVEPPVEPTPPPQPPVESPPPEEPPVEEPSEPIPPPPEVSEPVYPHPPPEEPPVEGPSEVVPPPPEVTEPVPPPPEVSSSVAPPPEVTSEVPEPSEPAEPPSQTSDAADEGETAAAVPNAQRAGGALIAAAVAAVLL